MMTEMKTRRTINSMVIVLIALDVVEGTATRVNILGPGEEASENVRHGMWKSGGETLGINASVEKRDQDAVRLYKRLISK